MSKNFKFWIMFSLLGLIIVGGIFLFTPTKYESVTRFAYSVNDGTTYQEGIKVIDVGTRYYLSVEMQIAANKSSPIYSNDLNATLKIPDVSIVDAYLFDNPGTKLTPEQDLINKTYKYVFKVPASKNPQKVRVIIEFVANQEGIFTIELSYDKLSEAYSKTETVRFIKNQSNNQLEED